MKQAFLHIIKNLCRKNCPEIVRGYLKSHKSRLPKAVFFLATLTLAVACNDEVEAPPQSFLMVAVKNSDKKVTTLPKVSAYGLGESKLWIDKDSTGTVLLPLKVESPTDFVLVMNGMYDTIRFISDSKIVYESMESGFYYEYELKDIFHTSHRIDSILVKNTSVTKNWNENIRIYINSLPVSSK